MHQSAADAKFAVARRARFAVTPLAPPCEDCKQGGQSLESMFSTTETLGLVRASWTMNRSRTCES